MTILYYKPGFASNIIEKNFIMQMLGQVVCPKTVIWRQLVRGGLHLPKNLKSHKASKLYLKIYVSFKD